MARKLIDGRTPKDIPLSEFCLLVSYCSSISDILVELGYQGDNLTNGRAYKDTKKRIETLGLNTDHFDLPIYSPRFESLPEDVLTQEFIGHRGIIKRAIRAFRCRAYQCDICGQKPIWRGKPLVLILDHINGNNRDHRPSNLRWLCPRCDTQQPTFAGRNRKNPLKSGFRDTRDRKRIISA